MKMTDEVMEVRSLIPSSQVGGIIGKGGSNIAKVREQSGAFISILKNDQFAALNPNRTITERICIFKGTADQVAHAARILTQLIVDTSNERLLNKAGTDREKLEKTALKLLVHRSQVGSIIGKGGSLIKETQQNTSTRIQVSNDVLANSTEKSVNIIGTPDQIHAAMQVIVKCLHDNPLPPNTKNYMYVPGTQQLYSQQRKRSSLPDTSKPGSCAQESTQKIAIPSVCAGTVIGRHGATIRELRQTSGTQISIADADSENPDERIVTLTGTSQGIQTAVSMIRQLVEQYKPADRE